jgi:hypothetical protein
MTTNRERDERGARQRTREQDANPELERRRDAMQAAEGHAGSIPRGNQQEEREVMGSHRIEWERVLGH